MKVESIRILGVVEDIFDTHVDVSVTLENGHNSIVVVATQKNLLTLMDNEESDFLDSTLLGFTFFRKNKKLTGQSFLQGFFLDSIFIILARIKEMIKSRLKIFIWLD
jgi:hypothetical protein